MSGEYRTWDIWYARVKFEDSDEVKRRPVVIINQSAYILCLKVTSNPSRNNCTDEYPLRYWKEAGLSMPSTVRLGKKIKLIESDFDEMIGRLHTNDILLIQYRLLP